MRAKYRNVNFTMRTNPLTLSLKYALLKNVIKTMAHNIYNMRFIGEAGRPARLQANFGQAGGEYFLQSIFFNTKTPMIIPIVISERELENVNPNRRTHKAISVIWFRILISIF
jgi:hypothetical protein